jgi:hypothetical protein
MTQGRYVELSVAQRTEVWRYWKAGKSLHTTTLTPEGTLPILEVHAVFAIRAFLPLPSRNVNR